MNHKGSRNPNYGNRGILNPLFGKRHSEETKAKIRAKSIGRKLSEEAKAKLRNIHRSEATKEKLRRSHMGERNVRWKGDKATAHAGRNRAQKLFKCPKGKDRHHIDGNPLNNAPENIAIETRKQHMILDGRIEKIRHQQRNPNNGCFISKF